MAKDLSQAVLDILERRSIKYAGTDFNGHHLFIIETRECRYARTIDPHVSDATMVWSLTDWAVNIKDRLPVDFYTEVEMKPITGRWEIKGV